MKTSRLFAAAAAAAMFAAPVSAQEFPKPGPEHAVLKKMEGKWDLVMKFGAGGESKGTVTYKMELGGLWLASNLETEFGGQKFQGKGMDTYDPSKKVYRSVWIDNMAFAPMLMEGTYDKDKKTLTLTGDGPTPDGKTAKWKSVTVMPDDDTINFSMYVGDAKEPMFTIAYKRKK